MNVADLIVSPVLGAVIGYFTNWLAIKMLFRPHEERRVFGVRLPFTPGLIPKERQALSKKIGDVVSGNVLTEEVLMEYLRTPELRKAVDSAIDGLLDTAAQSALTPGELAERALGGGDAREQLESMLVKGLQGLLESEGAVEAVTEAIAGLATAFLKEPGRFLPLEDMYRGAKERALVEYSAWIERGGHRELNVRDGLDQAVSCAVRGKCLGDIFTDDRTSRLMDMAREKAPGLSSALRRFLEENPELDARLGQMVAKVAVDNIGRLAGLFINYDKLYEKIKNSLFEYIEEPENIALICDKAEEWLAGRRDMELETLLAGFSGKAVDAISDGLAPMLENALESGLPERLFDWLDGKAEGAFSADVYAAITAKTPDFDQRMRGLIQSSVLPWFRELAAPVLPDLVHGIVGKAWDYPASGIMDKLGEGGRARLSEALRAAAAKALETGGGYVIRHMDIGGIIENKINQFSMAEAEELIFGVVKRELSMITMLGGLLGFIIGLVPVIMGLF